MKYIKKFIFSPAITKIIRLVIHAVMNANTEKCGWFEKYILVHQYPDFSNIIIESWLITSIGYFFHFVFLSIIFFAIHTPGATIINRLMNCRFLLFRMISAKKGPIFSYKVLQTLPHRLRISQVSRNICSNSTFG